MSTFDSQTLLMRTVFTLNVESLYKVKTIVLKFEGGGAMVLGKLPVPGRPTNLDDSRARAYCACSRCRWGLFGHFYSPLSFHFSSPSLWETARYRLKYCL